MWTNVNNLSILFYFEAKTFRSDVGDGNNFAFKTLDVKTIQ